MVCLHNSSEPDSAQVPCENDVQAQPNFLVKLNNITTVDKYRDATVNSDNGMVTMELLYPQESCRPQFHPSLSFCKS